jgi:hypothetical protein
MLGSHAEFHAELPIAPCGTGVNTICLWTCLAWVESVEPYGPCRPPSSSCLLLLFSSLTYVSIIVMQPSSIVCNNISIVLMQLSSIVCNNICLWSYYAVSQAEFGPCSWACYLVLLGLSCSLRFYTHGVWTLYVIKGPQLPKKIRALASFRKDTFAAYGCV